jgi:hypothetical protein
MSLEFTPPSLHPSFIAQCKNLFFRQSFVNDIITCPQMALYGWLLGFKQESQFFSAVMGTAGHKVLEIIHKDQRFGEDAFDYIDLLDELNTAFFDEIQKIQDSGQPIPNESAGCKNLDESFDEKSADYAEMIQGYMEHRRNKEFILTLAEQSFVLEVKPKQKDQSLPPIEPYLFTGTIDQIGVYSDGTQVIRDIKFRDNTFKPSRNKLDLDIQVTIYAAAIAFGSPACKKCKPRYEESQVTTERFLVYDGPCEDCRKIRESVDWPGRFAERCEVVWMHDFQRYQRAYRGKKKGDYKGDGLLKTYRKPSQLKVLLADILKVCEMVRQGIFYRKPGDHCNYWCKFTEHCRNGLEVEIEDAEKLASNMGDQHNVDDAF